NKLFKLVTLEAVRMPNATTMANNKEKETSTVRRLRNLYFFMSIRKDTRKKNLQQFEAEITSKIKKK
ncbi:MAG TPA: hypothetical protein DCM08_04955, partial [Microscillaceae bacterium]|nr:hypothetical protein [Microscillaceae bacterium]